ncbi:hypothetical protein ACOSQ4_014807 [Xanthoceras sorbifolium]
MSRSTCSCIYKRPIPCNSNIIIPVTYKTMKLEMSANSYLVTFILIHGLLLLSLHVSGFSPDVFSYNKLEVERLRTPTHPPPAPRASVPVHVRPRFPSPPPPPMSTPPPPPLSYT